MNKEQKAASVESIREAMQASPHVILASFSGLSVNEATELRRQVRKSGGQYRVIKNRLAKLAIEGTGAEPLKEKLTGPCALAYHPDDPVGLAKALHDFAKDHPALTLVGGVVDNKDVLEAQDVETLSKMPGLPELRAKLLALFNTPATQLVRLISTPGTQLARVIDARRESMPAEE